jgi:hypothetical protein
MGSGRRVSARRRRAKGCMTSKEAPSGDARGSMDASKRPASLKVSVTLEAEDAQTLRAIVESMGFWKPGEAAGWLLRLLLAEVRKETVASFVFTRSEEERARYYAERLAAVDQTDNVIRFPAPA